MFICYSEKLGLVTLCFLIKKIDWEVQSKGKLKAKEKRVGWEKFIFDWGIEIFSRKRLIQPSALEL